MGTAVRAPRRPELSVARRLVAAGATLAVAESITGGLLAHRLTNVPGSADWFVEGCVTYTNAAKTRRLGVPAAALRRHGAVSGETAAAMAAGVRKRAGTGYGLATTGVAGPDPLEGRPVGTVYVAVAAGRGRPTVRRFRFTGSRLQIKRRAARAALLELLGRLS